MKNYQTKFLGRKCIYTLHNFIFIIHLCLTIDEFHQLKKQNELTHDLNQYNNYSNPQK